MRKCRIMQFASEFPKGHRREGQATDFAQQIIRGQKRHTIRRDTKGTLRKAFDNLGEWYVSMREWAGKPYNSSLTEFKALTERDGVGYVKVFIEWPRVTFEDDPNAIDFARQVATNDGLTLIDFWDWFGTEERVEAWLFHFDDFRYISDGEEVF
jgi:hypothetical protein